MKSTCTAIHLVLALVLTACGTPRAQKLAAVALDCRVVAVDNLQPIEGAELSWYYVGPSGERVDFGPFRTNRDGSCRVIVPPQELRPKHAIDYMAGGFYREVRVTAPGFAAGRWGEIDLHERIEKSSVRPVEFRLRTEPNQPPQRNAGSRPTSGDSSASETLSSLGPRG